MYKYGIASILIYPCHIVRYLPVVAPRSTVYQKTNSMTPDSPQS